jgi:hypothetical protein
MNNEQLMQVIKQIHDLINHETSPRFDDDGNEISDGGILDRIYAIVEPIVEVSV